MMDAKDIKDQITCRQFLERYGYTVNRSGFCLCPFHSDRKPSMKVYDDPKRGACCFVCHASGDLLYIAKRYYGTTFQETLKTLCDEFNLRVDNESSDTAKDRQRAAQRRELASVCRQIIAQLKRQQEDVYWHDFEEWLRCDRALQEAPGPFDEWSENFCYALTHRAQINENLKRSEERRRQLLGKS